MAQNNMDINVAEDCIMVGQHEESPLSSCPSSPVPEARQRKPLPSGRIQVQDGKIRISEPLEKIASLALGKSPENSGPNVRPILSKSEPGPGGDVVVDRLFSIKLNNQENQEKFMKIISLQTPTYEPNGLLERVKVSASRTHYECLVEGCTLPMATRGCAVRCYRRHNMTYRCLTPTCARSFGSKFEVLTHVAANHIEYFEAHGCLMEERACGYCNILYNKGVELKEHYRKNHSGVKYQTPAQLITNLLSTFPRNRLEGYNIEEEKKQDVDLTGIKLISMAPAPQQTEPKPHGPVNKYTEGRPLPMRQSYIPPSASIYKQSDEGTLKFSIDMLDLDQDELVSVINVLNAARRQKAKRS